jgi:ABC-type transport system involved in multi-copper enzyme maturation permease subunit
MPPHFPAMVKAELQAVFLRWSGRAALILALLSAFAAVYGLYFVNEQAQQVKMGGMPVGGSLDLTWRGTLDWALSARNFFVIPLLLVLSSASSLAGEIADNTLREVLVRPVSRVSVFLAKFLALAGLSAASLVLSWAGAALGGAAVFSMDADIGWVSLGYLASFFSDLGLITLTLAISSLTRSVGGVVVGIILYLIADLGARLLLKALGAFGVEWAKQFAPYVPGNALAVWENWESWGSVSFDASNWQAAWDAWGGGNFAGLAVLLTLSCAVAITRLSRMDVP